MCLFEQAFFAGVLLLLHSKKGGIDSLQMAFTCICLACNVIHEVDVTHNYYEGYRTGEGPEGRLKSTLQGLPIVLVVLKIGNSLSWQILI